MVEVWRALRALGSRATRGDLMLATTHPLTSVDAALHALMADGRVEVTVTGSAHLVYRLSEAGAAGPHALSPSTPLRLGLRRARSAAAHDLHHPVHFDAKTLRLLRAREGVVSVAELVEHTGLTVAEARREAERLTALYGGEEHTSLDGHVVYVFPELAVSAHGKLRVREPRPAWIRAEDPMAASPTPMPTHHIVALAAAIGALAWFASFPPGPLGRVVVLASAAGAAAGAAFVLTESLVRRVTRHPRVRLRRDATIRRYLLGHVFETALRGKGVVSVRRAVAHLRTRTGVFLSHRQVERVLHGLAAEFDATELVLEGDRFFGFRNVKRQFLASGLHRTKLAVEGQVMGAAIFDSGDRDEAAAERELRLFDHDLAREPRPDDRDRPASMAPPR